MKLIVGLGNPGDKYKNNRHNVGHMFVDYLKKNFKFQISNFKLIKTDGFMNESGLFVKKLTHKLEINNLIIVHDDLDIPLGKFHIQFGTGPQLHNGLESVENHLHSKDFWRLRIGIDNRLPDKKIAGEVYTLKDFTTEEKKRLETEIFPKILLQFKLNFKLL
jgi:PTH1 family peptidyl-tRNA hydrolase